MIMRAHSFLAEGQPAPSDPRPSRRYEAGAPGVQDRLAPHRDGNLLSFSILLSEPSTFDGGGLRFHSLGPICPACGGKPREGCRLACVACGGVGRLAIRGVGRGDLTTHCGKLLHEGYRVTRGRRYVVVGFVICDAPTVDQHFVNHSELANRSASGKEADHEVVGRALLKQQHAPGGGSRSLSVVAVSASAASARPLASEAQDDGLAGFF